MTYRAINIENKCDFYVTRRENAKTIIVKKKNIHIFTRKCKKGSDYVTTAPIFSHASYAKLFSMDSELFTRQAFE